MIAFGRIVAVGAAWLVAEATIASQHQWLLLGRHGECVPISALSRKVAAAAELRTPGEFVRHLRANGHVVQESSVPGTGGRAVEVKVPALELAVVFAVPELCRAGAAR